MAKDLQMSDAALESWTARYPDYKNPEGAQDPDRTALMQSLWGAKAVPLLANTQTGGRFAGAAMGCPVRACAGYLEMRAGAKSAVFRNPDSIENVVCLEGTLKVSFGTSTQASVMLDKFDIFSIPPGVRHAFENVGEGTARYVSVLNGAPDCRYAAVFARAGGDHGLNAEALARTETRFDDAPGTELTEDEALARITRFAKLVPYKRQLQANPDLPPEATETLTAGNVYPIIIPEGHQGRSRHAPLKGWPGLYLAIAECVPGDGPLPHAHFDTQESFVVLDGEWDMTSGFNDEFRAPVAQFDLIAIPDKVLRGFRNTGKTTGRLLAFIQGQEQMSDLVAFPNRVGDEIERRFGPKVVEEFKKIRMTFDAEQR